MNSIMKKSNGNSPASFSGLVDQIFQNNLSRFFNDELWDVSGLSRNGNVPVNIRETEKSYEMELVAPGLKKDDFRVNISGDMLTVSFEQKEENNESDTAKGWVRKEYKTRSFSRSFRMDESVDAGKISASYTDGILRLDVPKKEDAQKISREIAVQ